MLHPVQKVNNHRKLNSLLLLLDLREWSDNENFNYNRAGCFISDDCKNLIFVLDYLYLLKLFSTVGTNFYQLNREKRHQQKASS